VGREEALPRHPMGVYLGWLSFDTHSHILRKVGNLKNKKEQTSTKSRGVRLKMILWTNKSIYFDDSE
jgi:hypothetical protein